MRVAYPSDISCNQFALIVPILERARKKTRRREVDLYEVFCGVLYVCQDRSWLSTNHRSELSAFHR